MKKNTQSRLVIFVGRVLKSNLNLFLEEGYKIGFFQDIDSPQSTDYFDEKILPYLDFIIPIKFDSLDSIQKSLKHIYINPTSLLICTMDRYFYAQSQIAEILHLDQSKNMSVAVSRNLTNKYYQRKVFALHYPEISPHYKKIRTFHGAYLFTHKYGFPVIVKPANLSQGKLVNICNNLEELIQKVSYVLDHVAEVYKKQRINRIPQVIIEQYIQGKQFSVDSYVDKDGNVTHTPVCHQVISHDLGFDDFETYYSGYPSGLNQQQEKLIFETVSKAIKAMKIVSTPTHTEVKLTPESSCKIVEVNVRTGGYRGDMLKESYGFNHLKNAINAYVGSPYTLSHEFLKYSACPQFWAEKEGELIEIRGADKVRTLKSFVRFGQAISFGSSAGPVAKGYAKVCYAILAHKDKSVLDNDLKEIRNLIKIITT
jgi:hypothetical protein